MYQYSIPCIADEILFEAVLEPTGKTVDKLSGDFNEADPGEGELATIFGKRNKVAVGKPNFDNVMKLLLNKKQEISPELRRMIIDYDFYLAQLSCSFQPDNDCRFVWVRFGVELSATAKATGEKLGTKPIAYDIFPDKVTSNVKHRREIHFGSELKINFPALNVDLGGKNTDTYEYVTYEPQMFAYGLGRSSVAWNFQATSEHFICGNQRDLLLLIKTPKDSIVKGRFLIGAEVEVNVGGKFLKIPLGKRNDQIVEWEHEFQEGGR